VTPAHLHQRVAVTGGYEFLRELEALSSRTSLPEEEALELMSDVGVNDAHGTLADFLDADVLTRIGEGIGITTFGIRTLLLLEATNGGDLRAAFSRLGDYDASLRMYELVREGMTRQFLETLRARPGFRRLYLCSPWISFDARGVELLRRAVAQVALGGTSPELFVLTRPAKGEKDVPPPGVEALRELGATIFLHSQLHTKLYVREPDVSGGYLMAIVGSQNLTRSRYLELGIRINADSKIINQLITYFWEVTNASTEA